MKRIKRDKKRIKREYEKNQREYAENQREVRGEPNENIKKTKGGMKRIKEKQINFEEQ